MRKLILALAFAPSLAWSQQALPPAAQAYQVIAHQALEREAAALAEVAALRAELAALRAPESGKKP